MDMQHITVIGAGLAGSEAAWQLAERGVMVDLYEMRPTKYSSAHHTDRFAELVCSNSLRGAGLENAVGLLKEEMRRLGSLIMSAADHNTVPAGGALAVDRELFSSEVTKRLEDHPFVCIHRGEVQKLPQEGITIVASGPLTSDALAEDILRLTGEAALSFFDAAAPIVTLESIDLSKAFWASRYDKGEADYLNCPMTREEYDLFYEALVQAETAEVEPLELDIFVGKNYIVTLHKCQIPVLDRVADTWNKNPRLLGDGVGMLLYDILDALIDGYFPVLDQVDEQIDDIENSIFRQNAVGSAEQIFKLKRSLLVMRRIAAPLREVFNVLVRRDQPLLSEQSVTYLRDIYDHTLRIVDTIDTYRDILAGALDAYLSVVSNQLSSVMKTLTVAATVLISLQVISGIYGMNFKHMPELSWRYGYFGALGLMVVIAGGLLYYFRRIKWL